MYYLTKRLIRMWRARQAQRATVVPAVATATVMNSPPPPAQ